MNKFCITCGAEIEEAEVCPKCGTIQDAVNALRKFCSNCGASHHDHPPIKQEKVYVCPLCSAEVEKWKKKDIEQEIELSKLEWFVFLCVIGLLSIAGIYLIVVDLFGTLIALGVAFLVVLGLWRMRISLKKDAIVFLIVFFIVKIIWLFPYGDPWIIVASIIAAASFLVMIPDILGSLIVEFWYVVLILIILGVIAVAYNEQRRKKLKERKKALELELEDQLKELKEQLGRGAITQEEYEQKKKQLLEKSKA